MCGFFCAYNPDRLSIDSSRLNRALNTLSHRGPDHEGCFRDDKIFLGHRRLSILDLSSQGHQPMFSINNDVIIIFVAFYLSLLFRFDFNIPPAVISIITFRHLIGLIFIKIFCFRIFVIKNTSVYSSCICAFFKIFLITKKRILVICCFNFNA